MCRESTSSELHTLTHMWTSSRNDNKGTCNNYPQSLFSRFLKIYIWDLNAKSIFNNIYDRFGYSAKPCKYEFHHFGLQLNLNYHASHITDRDRIFRDLMWFWFTAVVILSSTNECKLFTVRIASCKTSLNKSHTGKHCS